MRAASGTQAKTIQEVIDRLGALSVAGFDCFDYATRREAELLLVDALLLLAKEQRTASERVAVRDVVAAFQIVAEFWS